MAILQILFAAIIHSLGKVFSTLFGWATALLFGRVTEKKQILMSLAMSGSVIWLAVLVGIIFPQIGFYLLAAFVPHAIFAHSNMVRLGMLIAAVLIPFMVGLTLVIDNEARHDPADVVRELLFGWPYTVGLGITLLMMLCIAPILKVQALLKRWTSQHIPVLVSGSSYFRALQDIEEVLESGGYKVKREPASWMLTVPTRVLTFFARKHVENMVANNLTVLCGEDFEILLHPSDLIISGPSAAVARLRALIVERLLFAHLNLTWDAKANTLENEMRELWQAIDNANAPIDQLWYRINEIDARLYDLNVGYEEWAVLYREKLQIEHRLLSRCCEKKRKAS